MQMLPVTCSVFTGPFLSHLLPILSTSELCLVSELQQQDQLQFSNQQPDQRVTVAEGSLFLQPVLLHQSENKALILNHITGRLLVLSEGAWPYSSLSWGRV